MCEKYVKGEQERSIYRQPVRGFPEEKISYMDRLPDEILEKILTEALLSSGFSWPSHVCQTYNNLRDVSARCRRITSRLAWTLQRIHIANGGEAGLVSVTKIRTREWSRHRSTEHYCPSRLDRVASKASISWARMVYY